MAFSRMIAWCPPPRAGWFLKGNIAAVCLACVIGVRAAACSTGVSCMPQADGALVAHRAGAAARRGIPGASSGLEAVFMLSVLIIPACGFWLVTVETC